MAQWWERLPPTNVARVEFVVGSLSCPERFFSGYSRLAPSPKTNISNFQFDQESGRRRTTLWMCYLQIIIYLFYSFKWTSSLLSQVAKCRVRVCTEKRMYHCQQVNSFVTNISSSIHALFRNFSSNERLCELTLSKKLNNIVNQRFPVIGLMRTTSVWKFTCKIWALPTYQEIRKFRVGCKWNIRFSGIPLENSREYVDFEKVLLFSRWKLFRLNCAFLLQKNSPVSGYSRPPALFRQWTFSSSP